MNRVYNNEAIMMLCIVRLLQDGAMDMAKLLLCMVLAIDDRLNAKAPMSIRAFTTRATTISTSRK